MRRHWLTLGLTVLLLVTLPIIYIQAQQLQSVRTILNDVWDKANRQLMSTPWIGGAASGQAFQSEQTIYNDVWDAPNHMLRTSGGGAGGSGGPFNLTTTGVNSGQTLTVGAGSSIVTSSNGIVTATKWDIAPNPCGSGLFVTGQGADKSLTCNQVAFSNLSGVATDAQIPELNTLSTSLTPGRCVEVDGTGKLSNAAAACGTGGGGGGDASTNTVTSIDSEITLFSGTGGKLLKRATTTGMLKASAGVLTAAVAGVDYVLPGGNAATASGWDTAPAGCGTNQFAIGQNANKSLNCSQPVFSNLSGVITDPQVPDLNTLSTGLSPSRCVETDGTGKLVSTASSCSAGGGGGDASTNTAVSVDSEVALFSGAGGKTLKRATTTGLLKASSGVLSAAIAGTDYVVPGGTVATATQLAADPAPCGSGTFVTDMNAAGLLTCTTPFFANLSGVATDAQIPDLNTLSTSLTPGRCVQVDGTGKLSNAAAACGSGGGGAGFDAITSGNNTTAAMHVGAGASLDAVTGGIIDATKLGGVDASGYAKLTGPQVLSATQVVPRPVTQTITANAFTVNVDTTDIADVPALSAPVTVNAPTATGSNPRAYQELTIVFAPTTAPRGITWNTIFSETASIPLPTTTVGDSSTWNMVKFLYVPTVSKYTVVASTSGITRGITTLQSSVTYTCDHSIAEACEMQMTGTAGTLTVAAPIGGTPPNGRELTLRFLCSPNAQDFVWNAIFVSSPGVGLPTTCPVPGAVQQWLQVKFLYSGVLVKWQAMHVNVVDPQVTTLVSATTYTCPASVSKACEMQMTGSTGTLTIAPPSGTPMNGQMLLLRVMCTNTQTLSWNAAFVASPNVPLPTSCSSGVTSWNMYGVIWSSVLAKWQLYASN